MKKFQLKGFVAGVMTCLLTIGIIGTAAATTGKRNVNISYDNIKVTLNGNEVALVDAEGYYVEPFLIDGTTYLPVRAVATALGLDVGWDGATKTVKLTTKLATPVGTLVLDKNDVKIYYNGVEENDSYLGGYKVNFTIENNSAKDVIIRTKDHSINGYMSDADFSCNVASGKKANASIVFRNSYLEDAGITGPISNIELRFYAYDSSSYKDLWTSDPIKL